MRMRATLTFGILLTLAACSGAVTTAPTADDLTNDAPESLADAETTTSEPSTTSSTAVTAASIPSSDVTELANVVFLDESNQPRQANEDEAQLSTLILDDLNSLGYRWDSSDVVVDVPHEQPGDVTLTSTYTATAWTSLASHNFPDRRTGARVVYNVAVTPQVTTADGAVLDPAIVNDCLNLGFCPEGVGRDTVAIDQVVTFDRVAILPNCVESTDEEGTVTVGCEPG